MHSPHQVPTQPGRWRAIILALLVHLLLLGLLWFGINWQSDTPLSVEAEIWDHQVREAAPPSQPEPSPPPEPAPQQEPHPQARAEPPAPPKMEEAPVVKPDIALEQERKEQKARLERERLKKQEKLEADRQLAEQKKSAEAQARKEAEAEVKKKAEAEVRKKTEAEARKKTEVEVKKKAEAEARKKAEAEAAAKKQQQDADNQAAEQRHQADMARLMGQATGTAAKSQGPRGSADYIRKLGAKIRSNTIYNVPGDLSANPAVEYTVELLPDGSVRNIRKNRSSGIPGFDEAVLQAINKSQPFPPDKDGKVPGDFTFTHLPKDQ